MSNQHVTKRSDGNWQVRGEGNSRATVVTKTQREAISKARIRNKNSYGNDPCPPRDKK